MHLAVVHDESALDELIALAHDYSPDAFCELVQQRVGPSNTVVDRDERRMNPDKPPHRVVRTHLASAMLTVGKVVAMHPMYRNKPLVLVLAADPAVAADLTEFWHGLGAVVVHACDEGGCLRVATAVGPDVIVVDHSASRRLLRLIGAHPVSARAQLECVEEAATHPTVLAA